MYGGRDLRPDDFGVAGRNGIAKYFGARFEPETASL